MEDERGYWYRRGVTRRRLLAGALAGGAGAAAVAAVGCGGGEESKGATASPSAKEGTPQRGGIAKLMLPGEPGVYDPQATLASPGLIWPDWVGSRLMHVDPDTLNPTPHIIEKWEFADPTTLVLHVRDGVRFQDLPPANGRAMTAQDVAYTLERARTDDPKFLNRARYAKVDKVEVTDQKTVTVKLKTATIALLTFIGGESVMNREAIEAAGGQIKTPKQAVGTGPFMVSEYQAGVGGKLVRNPNYWESGKPYLDGVQWSFIQDQTAVIASFRTGDLDYGTSPNSGNVDATGRKQLQSQNPAPTFVPIPVSWVQTFLTYNDRPPFNDIRMRKVIDLVADRDQILQLVKSGDGGISGPIWEKALPGYGLPEAELRKRPGFRTPKDDDLKEAKQLLSAAGYPNGFDLPADGTEYVSWLNLDSITASVQQFAKIGIKLHVDKLIDRATFVTSEGDGTALFRCYGAAGAMESQDQLRVRYHSTSLRNYERYKVAEVDRLIDKQDTVLDTKERQALTLDIQRRILDDVAMPHLIWGVDYSVIQPWMKGIRSAVSQSYGEPEEWWKAKA